MRDLINIVESKLNDAWFKDGFETYKKPAKEKYEIASKPGTIEDRKSTRLNSSH